MKKHPNTKKKKKRRLHRRPTAAKRRKNVWLNVLPEDKWVKVRRGVTVFEALCKLGLDPQGECGGEGTCGKCKVRVVTAVGPPGEAEKKMLAPEDVQRGVRLACLTRINKDLVVHTAVGPGESELFQILKHSQAPEVDLDPLLTCEQVAVQPPDTAHPQADFSRLRTALGPKYADLQASPRCLTTLYRKLRRSAFRGQALLEGNRLLEWVPTGSIAGRYGLVFDIGTTTLVGKLIDLTSGREVGVISRLNSQTRFGTNVISRIQFVRENKNGLPRLRQMLIRDLNRIGHRLMEANELEPTQILVAVAAGNTTMQHFLLGLNPSGIAEAPFAPVVTEGLTLRAAEVGLEMHPDARIFVMPAKSGYIGGDLIGFILASGAAENDEPLALGVDFGTNGEIFLGNGRRMLTCSAAAGPALEGARISCGMIARAGAIEGVRMENGRLCHRVIGNIKARGLCGSGLVDLVATLLEYGAIDSLGRLGPHRCDDDEAGLHGRLVARPDGRVYDFLVAGPDETFDGDRMLLTQKDVRELQLAKGAVAAGVQTLMAEMGITIAEVDVIYLAGALGNYMDPAGAMRIGLIPAIEARKVVSLGNAASAGAKMALLSRRHWRRAAEVVRHVEHVELSMHPRFMEAFVAAMHFPGGGVPEDCDGPAGT